MFWHRGARPPGVTHHVGRTREKKEAAKKFLGRKKTLPCSQRRHDKIACRLQRQCADTKGKLCIGEGPR